VVNEALADACPLFNTTVVDDSGGGDAWCFKNSTWWPAVPSFVGDAFFAAREACSGCQLFYNDYNIAAPR
jgi:GH35 family endo-1,4-beta-xylanase